MTRRERLERKLEKREQWAESRRAKSDAASNRAHALLDPIPLGQPILVGHHSERGHRRTLERADNAMRAAVESDAMAAHHESKAAGIERQLETSIFSDDDNAVEALREKIAGLEVQRDYAKKVNAAYRKAGKPETDDTAGWQRVAELAGVDLAALNDCRYDIARFPYYKQPFPAYVSQNLGNRIRQAKQRIEAIEAERKTLANADDAGGVMVTFHGEGIHAYARVTFAEKPEREAISELKAAGFYWSRPSWYGKAEDLPAQYRKEVQS